MAEAEAKRAATAVKYLICILYERVSKLAEEEKKRKRREREKDLNETNLSPVEFP